MESDLFERMSDVELLGELRRIANHARRRQDRTTAERATVLFTTFYDHRLLARVPESLWTDTRTFVRQHAS